MWSFEMVHLISNENSVNYSTSKRVHRRMDKGNMERRAYRHGNLVRMETPGKPGNFNNHG